MTGDECTFVYYYSGKPSNCFGCASAAVEHCITLLRALVTNTNLRHILCSQVRNLSLTINGIKAKMYRYSEVLIIRLPMVLVNNGLNSEQVSLMKPICIFALKTAIWYRSKWS